MGIFMKSGGSDYIVLPASLAPSATLSWKSGVDVSAIGKQAELYAQLLPQARVCTKSSKDTWEIELWDFWSQFLPDHASLN